MNRVKGQTTGRGKRFWIFSRLTSPRPVKENHRSMVTKTIRKRSNAIPYYLLKIYNKHEEVFANGTRLVSMVIQRIQ